MFKSCGTAYMLWFVAMHRFYLGRPFTGLLYILTLGGCGLWAILDFFRIPSLVHKENAALARLFRSEVHVHTHVLKDEGDESARTIKKARGEIVHRRRA